MGRSAEERERLKNWAMNWRPQPTRDRLNGYRKAKFGRWRDYHQNRLVLRLTADERRKAESIYGHLVRKHRGMVMVRGAKYKRVLWACAVSLCRKKSSNRHQHQANTQRLIYWQNRAIEEGYGYVKGLGKIKDESLKRLEEENRLANQSLHQFADRYPWDE